MRTAAKHRGRTAFGALLLSAAGTAIEVCSDARVGLAAQRAIDEGGEPLGRACALRVSGATGWSLAHTGSPIAFCSRSASRTVVSRSYIILRPRAIRDITVPIGIA